MEFPISPGSMLTMMSKSPNFSIFLQLSNTFSLWIIISGYSINTFPGDKS